MTLVTLSDYIGAWWDDAIADHTDDIGDAMLRFLAETGTDEVKSLQPQVESEGEVAGISYQIRGSGPPLLLMPLCCFRLLNGNHSSIDLGSNSAPSP